MTFTHTDLQNVKARRKHTVVSMNVCKSFFFKNLTPIHCHFEFVQLYFISTTNVNLYSLHISLNTNRKCLSSRYIFFPTSTTPQSSFDCPPSIFQARVLFLSLFAPSSHSQIALLGLSNL